MRCLIVVIMVVMGAIAGAAEVEIDRSDLGTTWFVPMESAPFPHESRAEGFASSNGQHYPVDPHYSDSTVAIFVPEGFRPAAEVDLVFYFHGHNNSVRAALESFRLREMFVASNRNAVLVFPEGPKDAPDSTCGRLEEAGAFARITEDVIEFLRDRAGLPVERAGRIVLSGHSGAYRVLSFAVEHGGIEDHVTDVFLLDASYARNEEFLKWLQRQPEARLRSVFTEHLAARNVQMMAPLAAAGVPHVLRLDTDVTEEHLRTERVVFVHTTTLNHNQTVGLLEPWLRTSRLDPISE